MNKQRTVVPELTARQRQVMNLIAGGRTNGEIAESLGITLDGAKWHVTELLNRFGVSSREELVDAWESRERGVGRWLRGVFAVAGGSGGAKLAGPVAVAVGASAFTLTGVLLFASGGSTGSTAGEVAGEANHGVTLSAAPPDWYVDLAMDQVLARYDGEAVGASWPAEPGDVVASNAQQSPLEYSVRPPFVGGSGALMTFVFSGPMPEGSFRLKLPGGLVASQFDGTGFYSGAQPATAVRWYVRFELPSLSLVHGTIRLYYEDAVYPTPTPGSVSSMAR